jgi:uncharacterized delta-60 repeat protein
MDKTFANEGVLILYDYYSITGNFQLGIQPDGKILVFDQFAGYQPVYHSNLLVLRLNSDGSLDNTFGTDGRVLTSFDNYENLIPFVRSVVFTVENQMIVIGSNYNSYWGNFTTTLIKYNADGSTDNNFDFDGILRINFNLENGQSPSLETAALQDNGKIILGGFVRKDWYDMNIFLARLLPDGSLDNTFNSTGYVIQDFGSTGDHAQSVFVSAEGIITGCGATVAFRYLSDGTQDLSFGEQGKVSIKINNNNSLLNSVTALPGGELFVTGTRYYNPTDCVVIKLDGTGKTDITFGGNGITSIYIEGGLSKVTGLYKQTDGKLLCTGTEMDGSSSKLAFARFAQDGSPDLSFGNGGKLVISSEGSEITAMQSDGKIIAAYYSYDNSKLIRFNTDGSPDGTFAGLLPPITGYSLTGITQLQVQGNDKILVVGLAYPMLPENFATGNCIVVFRFHRNGTLDTGFGTNGVFLVPAGQSTQFYGSARGFYDTEVMCRSDGKIIIAGSLMEMPPYFWYGLKVFLARLNPNGTLDNTFDSDGVIIGPVVYEPEINSILQPDNKILYNSYLELLRFNEDGTPDAGFGGMGKITTQNGGNILLQDDGKIIKSGIIPGPYSFVMYRYNTDGTQDLSFGNNGMADTEFGIGQNLQVKGLMVAGSRYYAGGFALNPFQAGTIGAFQLSDVQLSCPENVSATAELHHCSKVIGNIDPVLTPAGSSASVLFTLEGATTGSGTGSVSGISFHTGITTVTYYLADNPSMLCSFTVTVQYPVTPSMTIIPSDVANNFCNGILLSAESNVPVASYQWSNGISVKDNFLTVAQPSGVYAVTAVPSPGCPSIPTAAYDYDNQALASSFTLLGLNGIRLQQENTVVNGSVGVVNPAGSASVKKNVSIAGTGAFLKASDINLQSPNNIPVLVYGPAAVALPDMQYNSTSVQGLPNGNVPDNTTQTLAGNLKNVNVGVNCDVTLTGSVFGNITIGAGSRVLFTGSSIDAGSLILNQGLQSQLTTLHFAGDAVIRSNGGIQVNPWCMINPENHKLIIYMGKANGAPVNFAVTAGGNETVNASFYIPSGKITVGGDELNKTFMNGKFIADNIETGGKNIIWDWYDCSENPESNKPFHLKAGSVPSKQNLSALNRFSVKAWPNPAFEAFHLKVESDASDPVQLKVYDVYGRLLFSRVFDVSGDCTFGKELINGMYIAELIQGKNRKTLNLVKNQ